MVKEFCILMKNVSHIMMVIGNGERDMDWVFINTDPEISTRDNGQIILEMEKVCSCITLTLIHMGFFRATIYGGGVLSTPL